MLIFKKHFRFRFFKVFWYSVRAKSDHKFVFQSMVRTWNIKKDNGEIVTIWFIKILQNKDGQIWLEIRTFYSDHGLQKCRTSGKMTAIYAVNFEMDRTFIICYYIIKQWIWIKRGEKMIIYLPQRPINFGKEDIKEMHLRIPTG